MTTPSSANNVVRLPTAARRRVRNPGGLALVAAREGLPRLPAKWPADHESGRKVWQEAHFTRSPEMIVLTAMLKVLAEDQKARVRQYISTLVDIGYLDTGAHGPSALVIVEAIT